MDGSRDWTGTWETNYGKVMLRQSSHDVTGNYILKQGRISGRTMDNKLTGVWSEAPSYSAPNDAGEFEIVMDKSGRSFKGGWWKTSSGKVHEWFGKRD